MSHRLSALIESIRHNDVAMAQALLAIDQNLANQSMRMDWDTYNCAPQPIFPAQWAVRQQSLPLLTLLHLNGAKLQVCLTLRYNGKSLSLLGIACTSYGESPNTAIVEYLFQHGLPLGQVWSEQLMWRFASPSWGNFLEVLELFHRHGQDVNATDEKGKTALQLCNEALLSLAKDPRGSMSCGYPRNQELISSYAKWLESKGGKAFQKAKAAA
ncbi:MAG: hypothetical protein WAX89_06790 [Alphaproteobacteria bacterium]